MKKYIELRKKGNTSIKNENSIITVRFHETDIITHDTKNKTIILDSGGWRTPTTKNRINQYLSENNIGLGIFQKKGKWYIAQDLEFFDNIKINL